MSIDYSPSALATRYADIARELSSQPDADSVFRALTAAAVREVPGAEYAGITQGKPGKFVTMAPTDDVVNVVDEVQYDLGSGPCVDAIVAGGVFRAGDLRTDTRWPVFGAKAFEAAGIISMLSFRLFIENSDVLAGLNMYSTLPDAFDESSQTIGLVLATNGALAVAGAVARGQAQNLERALLTSREIGIAIGILMSEHKVHREEAFDLLRVASQHGQRKVHDLAADVILTGQLELPQSKGA